MSPQNSTGTNEIGCVERSGMTGDLFPLTPALSLGERGQQAALEESNATGLLKRRPASLPLLRGEGGGEGECGKRGPPRARHKKVETQLIFSLLPPRPEDSGKGPDGNSRAEGAEPVAEARSRCCPESLVSLRASVNSRNAALEFRGPPARRHAPHPVFAESGSRDQNHPAQYPVGLPGRRNPGCAGRRDAADGTCSWRNAGRAASSTKASLPKCPACAASGRWMFDCELARGLPSCLSGLLRIRSTSSPSPQPSPSGRGRPELRLSKMPGAPGSPTRCRRFSLSSGERAGVRGNGVAH